jgi:hypothetical protein
MPDVGKNLGVDIYELWLAGTARLPAVAALYDEARRNVATTDDNALTALTIPSALLGNHGEVLGPWTTLRNELLQILSDTATNLTLVGDALVMAAKAYADTDHRAEHEFDRLMREDQGRESHREAAR